MLFLLRVPIEFFESDKNLLPWYSLKLTFNHQRDMARLHAAKPEKDKTHDYLVELETCELVVKRVLLTPEALSPIQRKLNAGAAVRYEFTRNCCVGGLRACVCACGRAHLVSVEGFEIGKGLKSYSSVVSLSRRPVACLLWFTSNTVSTEWDKNPLFYEHMNLSSIQYNFEVCVCVSVCVSVCVCSCFTKQSHCLFVTG